MRHTRNFGVRTGMKCYDEGASERLRRCARDWRNKEREFLSEVLKETGIKRTWIDVGGYVLDAVGKPVPFGED